MHKYYEQLEAKRYFVELILSLFYKYIWKSQIIGIHL